jgi:hypothetical protein
MGRVFVGSIRVRKKVRIGRIIAKKMKSEK